jgi:hypothetical protein
MIKKTLLAVIAAGALSVPLAGMAWADPPSDNNPPGQGATGPGLHTRSEAFSTAQTRTRTGLATRFLPARNSTWPKTCSAARASALPLPLGIS